MSSTTLKRNLSYISPRSFYSDSKKPKNNDLKGSGDATKEKRQSESNLFNAIMSYKPRKSEEAIKKNQENNLSATECSLLTPDGKERSKKKAERSCSGGKNRKKQRITKIEEGHLKQVQITEYLQKTISKSPSTPNRLSSCTKKSESPLRTPQREPLQNASCLNDEIKENSPKFVNAIASDAKNNAGDCVNEEENKENVGTNVVDVDRDCQNVKHSVHTQDDPVPLKNLGNTCYMNAIVQSLFVLKCFMTDLKDAFDSNCINRDTNEMTTSLLALYSTYSQQKKLTSTEVIDDESISKHLSNLKRCVGEKNSQFKSSMQQDAVEFLDLILGAVRDEFFSNFTLSTENPVRKYFEIEFECFVKCITCASDSMLPNVTNSALYLCIPENTNNFTLQDAVSDYLKEERTQHKCNLNECGSEQKIRYTRIQKLPIVLFVQLGRYSDKGIKRHEEVEIPEKLYFSKLDNTSFQSDHLTNEENSSTICYQLISVICHYGNTLAGGHYVSYIFDEEKQTWFLCDDDTINESSLDKVQEGSNTCGVCFFYINKQLCP